MDLAVTLQLTMATDSDDKGEVAVANNPLTLVAYSARPAIDQHLEVWAACTDGGSDIACSRQLIASEMASYNWKWFFEIDCLAHQYQLLSLLSLQPDELSSLLGLPTNYYSCIAILMHLVRDNAREIWLFCVSEFTAVRALQVFKSIPPAAISGRWGQASKCEDWIEPWTPHELQSA
jgi:hypothetical protein